MWRVSCLIIILGIMASSCDPQRQMFALQQEPPFEFFVPTAFTPHGSRRCINDSLSILNSIVHAEEWALKMLDASGKLNDMYLNANKQVLGHFDQCLGIETSNFVGKYCTVFIQEHHSKNSPRKSFIQMLRNAGLNETKKNNQNFYSAEEYPKITTTRNFHQPRLALCVPSSCFASDVGISISHLLRTQLPGDLSSISIATEEDFCTDKKEIVSLNMREIIIGAIFSALAALILAGTCIESWLLYCGQKQSDLTIHTTSENKRIDIILCFSLITNIRWLMSPHSSQNTITCIYGLRFLLMSWVVLGHSWIQGVIEYNQNIEGLQQDGKKWQWQIIVNGTISVDGFFLLSGMLVSLNLLQVLETNKGKFNILLFYAHRYLRLTPVYVAIFAFVSTFMVYVGSGPTWFAVKHTAENCRTVWWQQFLYINNFIPKDGDKQCMPETWFLANEMQLFIVSPLFIYPLWRWRTRGLIVLVFTTLAALSGNIYFFYVKDMPPTSMITRPLLMNKSLIDFWVYYYPQPWFRSPPYLVGIFLGYILNVFQNREISLPKGAYICGWLLSSAIGLLVIYGLSPYVDEDQSPIIHSAVNILYGSFHRFAWALALSWIIFCCYRGCGGFINDFLSWPLFMPLGKLSYSIYLIHYNVIQVYYAHARQVPYYTPSEQIYFAFGNLIVSILLAVIACITVELPFIHLEKRALRSGSHSLAPNEERCRKEKRDGGRTNQAFSIT